MLMVAKARSVQLGLSLSHYEAHTDAEITVFLLQPSMCWDQRNMLPSLTIFSSLFIKKKKAKKKNFLINVALRYYSNTENC